jgi:hypothetical protein
VGRSFVWWILGLEMWGVGTRLKEKMEEAERGSKGGGRRKMR